MSVDFYGENQAQLGQIDDHDQEAESVQSKNGPSSDSPNKYKKLFTGGEDIDKSQKSASPSKQVKEELAYDTQEEMEEEKETERNQVSYHEDQQSEMDRESVNQSVNINVGTVQPMMKPGTLKKLRKRRSLVE